MIFLCRFMVAVNVSMNLWLLLYMVFQFSRCNTPLSEMMVFVLSFVSMFCMSATIVPDFIETISVKKQLIKHLNDAEKAQKVGTYN